MSKLEESDRANQEVHIIKPPTQKSRGKMILRLFLTMFIDIALPVILYEILSNYIPTIWALIISGVPPTISVIVNFILRKQVNPIGVLVIIGFIIGFILSLVKNDPRLFLLRESIITGVFGLSFIITLIPIKIGSFEMRPLLYYNSKNLEMDELKGLTEDEPIPERWERYWISYSSFRLSYYVLTAVWGFGLLIEVPARIVLIYYTATIDDAVYIGNIAFYSWLGCLILFTIIFSRYMKKKEERLLREQGAAAQT